MLAVCLWAAPVVQAQPSYSSADSFASYEAKPVEAPVVSEPGEASAAGDMGITLQLDVERTATLRRGRVPRIFYYPGQKGEAITIEVKAVSFPPEVSLKDPAGAEVALESKPDGEHSLKASAVLGGPGRYTIGVRSQNASNGLFHINVSATPEAETEGSDQPAQ